VAVVVVVVVMGTKSLPWRGHKQGYSMSSDIIMHTRSRDSVVDFVAMTAGHIRAFLCMVDAGWFTRSALDQ